MQVPGDFCGADNPCTHRCEEGQRPPLHSTQVGAAPPRPPWGGRSAPPPPGDFAGAGAPCTHYAGAPPCTRVTFPPRGKSPKARQGLRPWTCRCGVTALFALAALRSGSRRAGFCHRKRPICHFERVDKSVFVVSFGFDQEKYSAVNPWRGRRLVARLDATFGGIRGIGEGVLRRRAGVLCSLCRFCAGSVQQQMA